MPVSFRRMLFAVALGLLVCAASPAARAQDELIFTLENPNPTVRPGDVFQFVATLQNGDTMSAITLSNPSGSVDVGAPGDITNEYFDNEAPKTLSPNNGTANPNPPNTYTGRLFDVSVDANATDGQVINGTYSLDYQVGSGPAHPVTQGFSLLVHVAAVPEPGLPVSVGLLFGSGLLLRRRQYRSAARQK